MRPSSLVLVAVAVVCAATALWLGRALALERARGAALEAELGGLKRQVTSRRPAPPPSAQPIEAAVSRPAAIAASTVPPGADVEIARDPGFLRGQEMNEARRRLMAENPRFRAARHNLQRSFIESRYRDLPKVLGLSDAQTEQVFDLLADLPTRLSEGGGVPPPGAQRLADEAKLAAVLGESNLQRFETFRASLMSRNEVRMLGSELAGSADTLREDQIEPMVALVYEEQQRLQQEWADLAAAHPDARDPAIAAQRSKLAIATNARIVDASRSLLTAKQLAALKDIYRRQQVQMESQDEMNRLMSEAMSRPGAAGAN